MYACFCGFLGIFIVDKNFPLDLCIIAEVGLIARIVNGRFIDPVRLLFIIVGFYRFFRSRLLFPGGNIKIRTACFFGFGLSFNRRRTDKRYFDDPGMCMISILFHEIKRNQDCHMNDNGNCKACIEPVHRYSIYRQGETESRCDEDKLTYWNYAICRLSACAGRFHRAGF